MTSLLLLVRAMVGLALVCGAFVPGPCNFDPQRKFDCSLGDPCERNFACADDGYCKSADIACLDGETRCEYPGLDRVGICVKAEDTLTSKTHCSLCFTRWGRAWLDLFNSRWRRPVFCGAALLSSSAVGLRLNFAARICSR